ncbi:MAG: hypothetical protein K2N01_08775 [Lachnospiraceae bacterium]|nr:hypothetical protein [Lachnospiraceae bacterium]
MMLVNETAVKVKSQELNIPFSHLLPAAVLEHILWLLQQSDWRERLWLRGSSNLGLEAYSRKPVFDLSFYYHAPEHPLTPETLEEFFTELLSKREEGQLQFTYVNCHSETGSHDIEVTAVMGMIEVPVKLHVQELTQDELQPVESDVRLFLQNNQVIQFLLYPSEQIVVENFVTILEKMELINDLSPYLEIYTILGRETIEGRRLQQMIADEGRQRALHFREDRLDMILNYRNYTYMKKKWRAYLKRERRNTPSWEEVIDRFGTFFPPLWEAVIRDRVYIGDWMPELQRFLE